MNAARKGWLPAPARITGHGAKDAEQGIAWIQKVGEKFSAAMKPHLQRLEQTTQKAKEALERNDVDEFVKWGDRSKALKAHILEEADHYINQLFDGLASKRVRLPDMGVHYGQAASTLRDLAKPSSKSAGQTVQETLKAVEKLHADWTEGFRSLSQHR